MTPGGGTHAREAFRGRLETWAEGIRTARFDPPERAFASRRICVTGRITSNRGTAQIVVRDPSVVRLEKP